MKELLNEKLRELGGKGHTATKAELATIARIERAIAGDKRAIAAVAKILEHRAAMAAKWAARGL